MPTPATADPVPVPQGDARNFVAHYFGTVDLGHQSRNRCFARIAEQISRHPGGTLPDKLSNPAAYAAMDRLMNRPETTHAALRMYDLAWAWERFGPGTKIAASGG